jgi:cellulose biosynthesis protein BcsQ
MSLERESQAARRDVRIIPHREGLYQQKTLLVDMDPQGILTEYFINPAELELIIYDAPLYGFTVKPSILGEYIHLIPANIDLAKAEILRIAAGRNRKLE